jgi:hypothetical protein
MKTTKSKPERSPETEDPTLSCLDEHHEEVKKAVAEGKNVEEAKADLRARAKAQDAARPSGRIDRIGDDPLRYFSTAIKLIEHDGHIPQNRRESIARRLVDAGRAYQFRCEMEDTFLRPSKLRQMCEAIATSAVRLLKSLGVEDPKLLAYGWPTAKGRSGRRRRARAEKSPGGFPSPVALLLPDLRRVAIERRGNTVTMDALSGGATLLLGLSDLSEAAERVARRLRPEAPMGAGGKRRQGLSAEGALVHEILNICAEVSGRKPRDGGPLFGFVRACVKVIDLNLANQMTNEKIRGHRRRWQAERDKRAVQPS